MQERSGRSALQTLRETSDTLLSPHIKQWKSSGGKVLGTRMRSSLPS